MNRNHLYAYLLLGAVVLAGAGGFMMSDSLTEVSEPTIATGTISFTILDTSVESDGGESNGETT